MRTVLKIEAIAAALSAMSCDRAAQGEARHFSQAALDTALGDPGRKEQRESSDARRKPAELIALAGVSPGDKVVDLIPGNGYWTRIFSKIVGPKGKVYAVWPQAYAKEATGDVATLQKLSADSYYGNIVSGVQPTAEVTAPEPESAEVEQPEDVDGAS